MNPPSRRVVASQLILTLICAVAGCANEEQKDRGFFTSGSREADQRAEQRMAKEEQLAGDDAAEKEQKAEETAAKKVAGKKTLYERLGGEKGVQAIVDDFVTRALADPRVNWKRQGITKGGWYRRNKPVTWNPSEQDIVTMKEHIAQFIAVATGGPPQYDGKDMKQVHGDLHISNAEFDAAIGDLKAALDKQAVPNDEQKELLSVVESTRPQIVTQR